MFGIGFMEMMVIAAILIIAVGPNRLPTLMKTVGKAMREFRRATRELRAQSGIDELMADDDLRQLRSPMAPKRAHVAAPPSKQGLDAEAKKQEYPPEGVDFAVSREMADAEAFKPRVAPEPAPSTTPKAPESAEKTPEPAAKS
jgi:sec-independent protein translocase protein TatB